MNQTKIEEAQRLLNIFVERRNQRAKGLQLTESDIARKIDFLKNNGVDVSQYITAQTQASIAEVKQIIEEKQTVKSADGDFNMLTSDIHANTDPQQYMRKISTPYTEIKDEFTLLDAHFEISDPLIFEGPKGCGKSLALASWASARGIPMMVIDCSEGIKEGHLVGRLIVKGNSTPLHLGIIPTAIEVCNKSENGLLLIFEELNALTNQMQKLLNSILDWRKGIFVEAVGKYYEVKVGKQLLIVGTMNPSSYSGVNELNADLLSRFTRIVWDYPSTTDEKRILKQTIKESGIPEDMVKCFLKLAQETRASEKRADNPLSHSISTRELDSIFRLYAAYKKRWDNPMPKLVDKIRGMYEDEHEWNTVKSRIESIFGSDVFNPQMKKMTEEQIEEASQ